MRYAWCLVLQKGKKKGKKGKSKAAAVVVEESPEPARDEGVASSDLLELDMGNKKPAEVRQEIVYLTL